MPKRKFSLEPKGPKRLEVSWGMFFKNLVVRLDGQEIGRVAESKELAQGRDFPLPDGSTLSVRLVSAWGSQDVRLLRNGVPLPGSPTDPNTHVREASYVLYLVGGINLLLGVASVLAPQSEFLQLLGGGIFSLAYGLVFLTLAFFTGRYSLPALVIAIVLYLLDSLLWLVSLFAGPLMGNPAAGLIMRVLFVLLLLRGVSALRELKKKEEAGPGLVAV